MLKTPNLDDVFLVKHDAVAGVVSRRAILHSGRAVELTAAALEG